jgi:DNA-directed RNA polymerase
MPLTLNQNNYDNEIVSNKVEQESDDEFNKITEKKDEKRKKKFIEKQKSISENKEKNTGSKFFSYLVVFIISSIALIVLVDTFKTPLISVFPGLEIILFSLFETLHDIKLFIIDLY